jgi:hypothetical protein
MYMKNIIILKIKQFNLLDYVARTYNKNSYLILTIFHPSLDEQVFPGKKNDEQL